MLTILKTRIDCTELGFKRFLKYQIGYEYIYLLSNKNFSCCDYDRYANAIKIVDLYNQYLSLLTSEEKVVNDYIKYHSPIEREPNNYNKIFSIIYKKWLSIFYNDNEKLYKDINPIRIGKIMKRIRENHSCTMAFLARVLEVDVSTVSLYERGKRVPSLNYTAKFCAMFSIKIDDLINLTLYKHNNITRQR